MTDTTKNQRPRLHLCISLMLQLLGIIILQHYQYMLGPHLVLLQSGILNYYLDLAPRIITTYSPFLLRKIALGSYSASLSSTSLYQDIGASIRDVDLDIVACGSFADIYQATYRGRKVALKRIRISRSLSDEDKMRCHRAFQREVQICAQLDHPHILSVFGLDYTTFRCSPCIVLPWMTNGNFYDAVKSLGAERSRPFVHRWLLEVAHGVEYLHKHNVVHGDLRGPNVLFDEHYCVKLSDFGLSRRPQDNSPSVLSVDRHPRWTAPELLKFDGDDTLPYPDTKCDIYSFGCLCIEFCTQKQPFHHLRTHRVLSAVLRGERPLRPEEVVMPWLLWELSVRCWTQDPTLRPCISEVRAKLENFGIR